MAPAVICETMQEAVADIPDGITLLVPGFGVGQPHQPAHGALRPGRQGPHDRPERRRRNPATDEGRKTLGDLIEDGRVRKLIASFTAATHPSRASKARADGARRPSRSRAAAAGHARRAHPRRWRRHPGVLHTGRRWHAARRGQRAPRVRRAHLCPRARRSSPTTPSSTPRRRTRRATSSFRRAARNYNPIAAMDARHTFVEVEEPIVPAGTSPPDEIHTPGIYVERMVQIPAGRHLHGRSAAAARPASRRGVRQWRRATNAAHARADRRRHGARLRPGWVVNLGVGMPTLASSHVRPEDDIIFTSENGVIGYGRSRPPRARPTRTS